MSDGSVAEIIVSIILVRMGALKQKTFASKNEKSDERKQGNTQDDSRGGMKRPLL